MNTGSHRSLVDLFSIRMDMKTRDKLPYPSGFFPTFFVIRVTQVTDDDSFGYAGMGKITVF